MCKCIDDCVCNVALAKKLDLTKPVQTITGQAVRILCTDSKGFLPVVALVTSKTGGEYVVHYDAAGNTHGSIYMQELNLVNAPEKKELFQNVYKEWPYPPKMHPTREEARNGGIVGNGAYYKGYQGCVKYTYEDDKLVGVELLKE